MWFGIVNLRFNLTWLMVSAGFSSNDKKTQVKHPVYISINERKAALIWRTPCCC